MYSAVMYILVITVFICGIIFTNLNFSETAVLEVESKKEIVAQMELEENESEEIPVKSDEGFVEYYNILQVYENEDDRNKISLMLGRGDGKVLTRNNMDLGRFIFPDEYDFKMYPHNLDEYYLKREVILTGEDINKDRIEKYHIIKENQMLEESQSKN